MEPRRRGELQDALDLLLSTTPEAVRASLPALLLECGVWSKQISVIVKTVEDVCVSEGVVSPGASICLLRGYSAAAEEPPSVEIDCARNTLHHSNKIVWRFFPNVWLGVWECHVWLAVVEMPQPTPAVVSPGTNSWLHVGVCN